MLNVLAGVFISYIMYYFIWLVKKPIIACNEKNKRFLLERMPILSRRFWPTIWCTGYRMQTILRSILKSCPKLSFEREFLQLNDNGEISLDWVHPKNVKADELNAIILIMPGLIGSSDESYCRHYAEQALMKNCRAVVFNYRGNGGSTLKTAKTYCATYTDDLAQVIAHIRKRYPKSEILATGISLGGLILTNYLAKVGDVCELKAGLTISTAWNVFESCKELENTINWFVFNRILCEALINKIKAYAHLFETEFQDRLDLKKVWNSRTLREFDDSFTSHQFGYASYVEYYRDACLYDKVNKIPIPLLCLNAADDPFSPNHAIPIEDAMQSDNVTIVVTSKGGHIGFLEGMWPSGSNYMDTILAEYIDAIFKPE